VTALLDLPTGADCRTKSDIAPLRYDEFEVVIMAVFRVHLAAGCPRGSKGLLT
jgi:hypothetical protein